MPTVASRYGNLSVMNSFFTLATTLNLPSSQILFKQCFNKFRFVGMNVI